MEKPAAENRKAVYLFYTLGFCILLGIIIFFNTINGKSFIHTGDAWDQQYPVFLYLGRQLRNIISTRTIHFYDFSIGLGGDIISALHNNTLGDPINLLAVFAVGRWAVYIYAFALFLRIYLSGIGMVLYCVRHGRDRCVCVWAGVSYAFSLFILVYGFQYDQTLNAAYLFPLLLICLEELLKCNSGNAKTGVRFALLVAVQACCSYYFLYMQTIVLFVYAIVDFWAEHWGEWHLLWKKFLCVTKYYLLGIMTSSTVLFPAAGGFLKSARAESGISGGMHLFWTVDEIKFLIADLFVPMKNSLEKASLGISIVAIMAVIVCCISKNMKERVLAILLAAAYICPLAWSVFNGFSYPTNRWMYVIYFAITYATAQFVEYAFERGGGGRTGFGFQEA